MRLFEVWQRHLGLIEARRGRTLRLRYERQLRRFLSFQQERQVGYRHLSEELLREFAARADYREDTVVALRQWLGFLYRQGLLSVDWQDELPRPVFRPRRLRRVPSHEQVLHFLKSLSEQPEELQIRALLEIAYGSGLRIGELVAVELGDLRWAEGSLVVRKAKNRQERLVPLTAWSRHALQVHLEKARPTWLEEHSGSALWLAPSGRPLQTFQVHRFLRQHQAGFTMHGLRHACATRLLEGGANVREIQELLGHVCLRNTQLYTHLKLSQLQAMHRRHHPRSPSLSS
jgi:site-specific recombinase XerD